MNRLIYELDYLVGFENFLNLVVKVPTLRGYGNYITAVRVIKKCSYPTRVRFWRWLYKYNSRKYLMLGISEEDYLSYAK